MPRIDVKCDNDHIYEVDRRIADYPSTPSCPECGADTVQIHLPRATQWTLDPVIVYRAADGSFTFPSDVNGSADHRYAAQGLERIELRSAADVRRFESVMNKREYSRAARRVEIMHAQQEARQAVSRSELRRQMESMSERGRGLARAAIEMNNNKPKLRPSESGFHVEAFSYDRSNRPESRDSEGRRRRD